MNREELKELIEENLIISLYYMGQELNENSELPLSEEEIRNFLIDYIEEGIRDTIRSAARGALDTVRGAVRGIGSGSGVSDIYNLGRDILAPGDDPMLQPIPGRTRIQRVLDRGAASLGGITQRQQRADERDAAAREAAPFAYGAGNVGGMVGSVVVPGGAVVGAGLRGAGLASRVARAGGFGAARTARAAERAAAQTATAARRAGQTPIRRIGGDISDRLIGDPDRNVGLSTTERIGAALHRPMTGGGVTDLIPGQSRTARIARGVGGVFDPMSARELAIAGAGTGAAALEGGLRGSSPEETTIGRTARRAQDAMTQYLGMSYEPEGEMLPESVSFSDQELAYIDSIMNEAMPVAPTAAEHSPNPTPTKKAEGSRAKGSLSD